MLDFNQDDTMTSVWYDFQLHTVPFSSFHMTPPTTAYDIRPVEYYTSGRDLWSSDATLNGVRGHSTCTAFSRNNQRTQDLLVHWSFGRTPRMTKEFDRQKQILRVPGNLSLRRASYYM
jgi:hypothetical protein